ncbi:MULTISPECIES: gas vesicle protein K [unclassified Streptomyces]|uniref:gas vesicle protein K n=1 Tax=Streptomyces sp. NPDC127129 TaxID=3345373 RepID=UPI00362E0BA7
MDARSVRCRSPSHGPRHRAWEVTPMESTTGPGRDSAVAQRLSVDPDTVERDLIKLVLTIVELLRQLMERTAVHRVDQGDLDADEEERIGMTLMILHERMEELCERYGLSMDDLNLDLGPLGSLLPHDSLGR